MSESPKMQKSASYEGKRAAGWRGYWVEELVCFVVMLGFWGYKVLLDGDG